jgi:putative ABC transport system permease protein
MLARIAFRNILRHRRRTLITLAVMVFGVTALILFGGYKEVTFQGLRESTIHGLLAHIQVFRQGALTAESERLLDNGMETIEPVRAAIEKDPRVEYTAAQIHFMGLITNGEKSEAFMATAVEPSRDKRMRSQLMKSGEFLSDDDPDGVIIGELLARSLHVKAGDYLTLMTTTVSGALNGVDVKVRGTFTTGIKDYDERAVKIPVAGAQRLLHTRKVEKLLVMLKKTDDTAAVQRDLAAVFSARGWRLEMRNWSDLATFYHQVVTLYNGIFGFLGMVVFVIVVLSVANTVMMSIFERTREIGTMMAIGTRRGRIWSLFLTEGMLIGMLGGAVGLLFGSGLAETINRVQFQLPAPPGSSSGYTLEILLNPSVLAISFALAIVTATLSSVVPALKASRLEIVDALGHI